MNELQKTKYGSFTDDERIRGNFERIAVLIDADNTQINKMGEVLNEVSTYGRIVVKRAYGNWKKDPLKNWEDVIKRLAIKAEQQFDYVAGKNATDMALVIDAIELLYSKVYDAFVIVSSDSDFTPLAIKLRETGVYVIGVGVKDTPESFRNACAEFIYLENIPDDAAEAQAEEAEKGKAKGKPKKSAGVASKSTAKGIKEVHMLLKKAWDTYQDADGYAYISAAGSFLKRSRPDFDCRTYGHKKLPQLLEAFPELYEIKRMESKGGGSIVVYKCLK